MNTLRFAQGADLLIYDAQYTPDEYESRYKNWGHSTYAQGTSVARAAKVGILHLFHHDPSHDDQFVDGLLKKARKEFKNVQAAKEGMEVEI